MISRAGNLARASALRRNPDLPYTCGKWTRQGGIRVKKLTDKQKSRLWDYERNRNFQASRRLEGVEMP